MPFIMLFFFLANGFVAIYFAAVSAHPALIALNAVISVVCGTAAVITYLRD